ncbi:MAG: cytosine permease [Peptostreptococcaceae bacterium]
MGSQKVDNYALEQVPENVKRGWVSMFCVLVAIGVDLSSVILGAELANSMPIDTAILSVVVGSFFSAILYTLCSLVGSSTNLSTSMITKYVFGDIGAKVFSLAIGISLLGWFGVQVGFFSENARILFNNFNMNVDIKILSLVGGLLMMSTVIYGYKSMEKLSVYSVPLLLGLMFLTIFLGFRKNGVPVIDSDIEQTMSFAQGVSLAVSIIIVGAIISPDISRWAKSRKDCALASFFGILFGNSFMIIVSIILVKCMGTSEIMNIFLTLGLAIPGMVVLTLAQWTTNSSNIYSSSLSIALVLKNMKHKTLTIALGLIGTALAVLGIYEGFIGFLNLLSIVVAPVGGVYVAEYYIVKKAFENIEDYSETKPVVARSIIAWIVGIIVTALSTYGFITLTTIAPLDGFIVGLLSQVVIGKILYK